eukprot:13400380-Ditylum_brightwellii.AAC.1
MVFDTGGGRNSTVTKRVCHIFKITNHTQTIRGYGNEGEQKTYQIVNAAMKAYIPGRKMPIIVLLYYATLNEDEKENESFIVSFEMMKHKIHVDLVPKKLGGEGKIYVDEECIPFEWDNEKLFWKISKPNEEDLESLETFELNLLIHDMVLETGMQEASGNNTRGSNREDVGEFNKLLL